jgi:hypothetical protein
MRLRRSSALAFVMAALSGLLSVVSTSAAAGGSNGATALNAPQFVADEVLSLAFSSDPARTTGVLSPEGCDVEPGPPRGILGSPGPGDVCHTALWGNLFHLEDVPFDRTDMNAQFTSIPFEQPIVLGADTAITVHDVNPLQEPTGSSLGLDYVLSEVTANGLTYPLSSGTAIDGLVEGRNEATFELARNGIQVAAGSRLRLVMSRNRAESWAARTLFGGSDYGDAGIKLTVGHFQAPPNQDPTAPCETSAEYARVGLSGAHEDVTPAVIPALPYLVTTGGYQDESVVRFKFRIDLSGSAENPSATLADVLIVLDWDNDTDFALVVYDADGVRLAADDSWQPVDESNENVLLPRLPHCTDLRVDVVNSDGLTPGEMTLDTTLRLL